MSDDVLPLRDVTSPRDLPADSHGGSTYHQGRPWLLGGVVLLLLGCVLGVVVHGDRVVPGELSLLRWMHQPPNETIDRIAWWASRLGDGYTSLMAVTILTTVWCIVRGRPDLALFLAVASALRIVGPQIKWLFDSARPPLDLHALSEQVDSLGYPSGHTLGAVLVYGGALLAIPLTLPWPVTRWIVRIVCLVLMLLISWSRMRLGVHWPSDVAGGYLFGWGLLALLWGLALRRDRWERIVLSSGRWLRPRGHPE